MSTVDTERVQAVELGYYGHKKRRVGDIFDIDIIRNKETGDNKVFSKRWMQRVPEGTPITVPKAAGPIRSDNIPDASLHPHSKTFEDGSGGRRALAPSELVPANILNAPVPVVMATLKERVGDLPVDRLKILYKAEEEGQGRTTLLTQIDAMIADAAVGGGSGD
jgi:hypothetical protein